MPLQFQLSPVKNHEILLYSTSIYTHKKHPPIHNKITYFCKFYTIFGYNHSDISLIELLFSQMARIILLY